MAYERKAPRFSVNFRSTFAGEQLAGRGIITNLSVGGCSIESTITLPVHSTVGLHIQVPDSRWPLQVDRAIVRWVRGSMFGLEFESLSPAETDRLQHLLHDLEQEPLVIMRHPAQ